MASADKKKKQWLRRCILFAKEELSKPSGVRVRAVRGKSKGLVPWEYRLRRYGQQGRPLCAPMLSEFLWGWFLDIRSAVSARLHPRLVLVKARGIASAMLAEMRRTNTFIKLPILDKHWLQRWKRRYGITLRKPNKRYKCSRPKLLFRLRSMWISNIRVRALAAECLGLDPTIVGFDQKPLHFNELGSKNTGTLHMEGAPEVKLKENHAATRERFSLMTSVTSSKAEASAVGGPPLQVMFRGSTDRVLRGLRVDPPLPGVTLAFGPKGSYRAEHVVRFLEQALLPWTADREASADYRILYLDAYSAHLGDDVRDVAWARSYVVLYHWGCTTGVCQVNDTDLHAALERQYLYCESVSLVFQQERDPGNIGRTRQDVMHDVCAVWGSLDHTQAARGHKRVGLSNALDGSEDHMMTREAAVFWKELGMADVREKDVFAVRERVRAGELSWCQDSLRALVDVPVNGDMGVFEEEGMEAEGALSDGEDMWDDEAGAASSSGEDEAAQRKQALAAVSKDAIVVAQEGDAPEDIAAAGTFLDRRVALQAIAEKASAENLLGIQWHAEREMRKLHKCHQIGSQGAQPSGVMRRFLQDTRQAEHAKFLEIREETRKRKAEEKAVKAEASKDKRRKALASAKAKAAAKALAALPKHFTAESLGQGHKKWGSKAAIAAREAALKRLRLRAPPLPPAVEALWPEFVSKYAVQVGKTYEASVGKVLIEHIEKVTARLGDHLLTEDGHAQKPSGDGAPKGDPGYFVKWVRAKYKGLPKAASSIVI